MKLNDLFDTIPSLELQFKQILSFCYELLKGKTHVHWAFSTRNILTNGTVMLMLKIIVVFR